MRLVMSVLSFSRELVSCVRLKLIDLIFCERLMCVLTAFSSPLLKVQNLN